MKDKITIRKIAELAGVSSATVSKVLNNNGRYSEETRKKILDIIEKYNYQPNQVAKSLRTNKSKTIGIIVPDITNEFFAQIVLAIEKYCDPLGYSVFICNTGENEEKEIQHLKKLEQQRVDGLIYLSGSDKLLQMNTTLPIVCIDRKPKQKHAFIVTSDNFNGGYLAAKKLIENNCNHILIIRDYRDNIPTSDRVLGFESAIKDNSQNTISKYVLKVEVGIEQAKQAVTSLIKNNKFHFDGVFATTDWLAYGGMLALREHGIRIPEDVKIVGYDNISIAKYNSITSVNQNKELLGEKAAEILIGIIENKTDYFQDIVTIPVNLVERNSTFSIS
jgi:LacI family transcriptional regulator